MGCTVQSSDTLSNLIGLIGLEKGLHFSPDQLKYLFLNQGGPYMFAKDFDTNFHKD